MDQRKRLIELILACDIENEVLVCFKERPKNRQAAEIIADHLLANGIVCIDTNTVDVVKNIGPLTTALGMPLNELADLIRAKQEGRVIVPPVKVGDTVYGIAQPCGGCNAFYEVMTEEYLKMCQRCDRFEILEVAFDYELIPEWGKTVFLTKEQAEKALAERSDR